MPRNKLSDLNNHLFEILEKVKDGDIDLEQAKCVSDIAGKIIDIKKVECQQANILAKAGYLDEVVTMFDQPKMLNT